MSRKLSVPAVAEPLVDAIRQAKVFTRPTFGRFVCLMGALIITMGRHTVSRELKVMGPLKEGQQGQSFGRVRVLIPTRHKGVP